MKYLTEIRDEEGRSLPFLFVEIENIGKYSFVAYDAEIQKTVNVDTMSNCLGITTFKWKESEYVVAAVHNENAAKLYGFVEFINTQSIPVNVYAPEKSNICFTGDCGKNMVSNMLTLTINTSLFDVIRVLGECGSIVVKMSSIYNGALTLYDFLLYLCREHMLNVMSYETICLVSSTPVSYTILDKYIITIKLVHNSEANRFFTEMYDRARGSNIMKYVSDIWVDGKPVDYAKWPDESNMVVTTRNMNTKKMENVSDFPIDDCYGFSPRQFWGNCLIVRHTPQAAQLYKYIKSARTSDYVEPVGNSDTNDYLYIGSCAEFKTPQDAATKTLRIDGLWPNIRLAEPCGSIVCVENLDSSEYLSLYDFLISVCGLTGLNIMSYGTVQIFSDSMEVGIEIIFHHGVEADGFFSKMYMFGCSL